MKELFEEFVKVWPKDSKWSIQDATHGVIFLNKAAADLASPLRLDRDDRQNAPARTIIEDELIRLGRPVQVTFDAGYQNWCAYLPTTYIPHPDNPAHALNVESITPGMIYKGAPTRTEALLRVAIQAFKEGPHP